MKITFGEGIGPVKFGMTEHEIIELIGNPDKIKFDEDNVNRKYFEYYELKLRISIFLNFGSRIGYIESSNPKLELNNLLIIGKNVDVFVINVSRLPNNWEIVEYHSFDTYSFDEIWISIHAEYKEITGIQLGVLIDENDEYIWNLDTARVFMLKTLSEYKPGRISG